MINSYDFACSAKKSRNAANCSNPLSPITESAVLLIFYRYHCFYEIRNNTLKRFKVSMGKNFIISIFYILRDHGDKDDISSLYKNPVLGSDAQEHWPEEELRNWSTWNYEDGFVLGASTTRPWRQKRAGLPYGLSLLLDPNVDDYFCPASDSLGIRYILHTPLEMPHVMEFSSVADLEKEILIEVHPDVTNADDDIRNVEPNERLCLFGRERTLRFFRPYTGGNCEDECTADYLRKRCNCTLFYMPSMNIKY